MSLMVTEQMKQTAPAALFASAFIQSGEWEIISQAQAGSTSAFEQLVEKYERRIFRLAQNITHNREDAEDAMQNAFVKAFRKLSTFQGDSTFYTWLVRITVNEALMGLRQRRWNVVTIDDTDESDGLVRREEIEDWGPSPEQIYSQTELQDILAKTLRALAPGYRIVFQLRDVEGLSTRETAQALSLSSVAVKTRLRRARLKLRGSLNRYFPSSGRKTPANRAIGDRANSEMWRGAREL